MTAAGFALLCFAILVIKSQEPYYWNEHPKLSHFFNGVGVIGTVLLVAGITTVLWRNFP